jgi:peptidoglycan hydrolase CwlO-like protein
MNKTLKTFYAFIAGIVTTIIAVILCKDRKTKTTVAKTDVKIAQNNQQIKDVDTKIDDVVKQKEEVVEDIKSQEQVVEDIKEAKEHIEVKPSETVEVAKENILKKTNRGRKKKK